MTVPARTGSWPSGTVQAKRRRAGAGNRLPGGEPLLDRVPFVLRAVREDVIEHLVDGLPDDLQLRQPTNIG